MGDRAALVLLLLSGCVTNAPPDESAPTATEPADTGRCPGYLSKEDFIDPWYQGFCEWNVACEIPWVGDSMEKCLTLGGPDADRCMDLCATGPALAAMQAAAADPDCSHSPDGTAVPYCEE